MTETQRRSSTHSMGVGSQLSVRRTVQQSGCAPPLTMADFRDFHVKSNNFAKSQTSDIYIFLEFLKLNNGCKSCFNQKTEQYIK